MLLVSNALAKVFDIDAIIPCLDFSTLICLSLRRFSELLIGITCMLPV